MRPLLSISIAAAGLLAGLAGCSRETRVAGEHVILDERLALVSGKETDAVKRELNVPVDGTCVAFIDDDEVGLYPTFQGAQSKVEIDPTLYGGTIYVAALQVTRGSKISIEISSPHDMSTPPHAFVKIVCFDAATQTEASRARVKAWQAWSEATMKGAPAEESAQRRAGLMDVAIAILEAPGGDQRMAAWGHFVKGSLLGQRLSDSRGALTELRLSEKAFAAMEKPDPRELAAARFTIGSALLAFLNDATSTNPTPEEARVEATKIFTELAAESSPLTAEEKARAVKYLGVVCFQVADYACATRHFAAAADASHKLGQYRDELSTLHNLAVTENELGNYASAARYFDRVIPLIHEDSPDRYALYLQNAAVAYANAGDTSRAITLLLQALQSAQQAKSALDLGRVMYALGFVYWRRGDVQQAETYFTESLKQRRIASDASGLINSLAMTGRFARNQGRIDDALVLHREARERASTADMKMRATYELAFDHAAKGQNAKAIALARESLKETANVSPIRRAQMQIALADFLIAGQPDAAALAEADEISSAALAFAHEKSDTVLELSARHVRAKLLVARKKYGDARQAYEETIALIFDFRGTTASPEFQVATVAHEQETFREYVELLMRQVVARGAGRFAPASPDEEDALRVLELARSSGMAAARDVRLDAATQARIDALLQQMAAKRVRIAALNDRATPGKMAEVLQLEMAQLRAQVDKLRGGRIEDARSTKLPASVRQPWPAVAAGVTQLSYAIGKRNVYLWVRDAHGLRAAVLTISSAQLESALTAFAGINPIRSPAALEKSLAELSASLLPAGALDDASGSVEVVAEGSLGTLPFAALRVAGSQKRLVETHALRMITSMFDASAPGAAKPRAMAFVGVASNTGKLRSAAHEFPSLGAARAEARAIADLFAKGSDAARIKLLTAADGDADTIRTLWTGGADAVHFATHGLANLRYPSASLLLLPKGGGEESAYLTAGQVSEWRGDAGLVFLAACETAAGPARFAEGMSGLPRSFLGAGARGIVATLWPVEDVYESEFSVEFYRRFIVSQDAEGALAETQREWLKPRAGENAGAHQQRMATAWAHVFNAKPKSR